MTEPCPELLAIGSRSVREWGHAGWGKGWRRRQFLAGLVGSGLAFGTEGAFGSQGALGLGSGVDPRLASFLPDRRDGCLWVDLERHHLYTSSPLPHWQALSARPGSLIKLVVAATALQEGITHPERRWVCPGWYQPPAQTGLPRLPCWNYRGHGELNLTEAIAHSCNVYFYHLSAELGTPRLVQGLKHFGLWTGGSLTGSAPLLGTGQDPRLLVTPLQLLGLITILARRGQPGQWGSLTTPALTLSPGIWPVLQKGMALAVANGTCQGLDPDSWGVVAKTGTVPAPGQDAAGFHPEQDPRFQAWLGAYWPQTNPRRALLLYLHNGKAYEAALPVARRLIQAIQSDSFP